jgi:hypothetical protein
METSFIQEIRYAGAPEYGELMGFIFYPHGNNLPGAPPGQESSKRQQQHREKDKYLFSIITKDGKL